MAAEIRRLTDELHRWGTCLKAYERAVAEQAASDRGQMGEDQPGLERRLLDLAEAQNEAVRRWNKDPTPANLPSFEAELRRLHQAYGETLARLKALRAGRDGGGPPSPG
jgi:hypothetical protein